MDILLTFSEDVPFGIAVQKIKNICLSCNKNVRLIYNIRLGSDFFQNI